MTTQLRSHETKLARARHHITNLKRSFARWSSDSNNLTVKTDSEGGTKVFTEFLEELPPKISMGVGDALHCMRDCLDHIIFELASQNGLARNQEGCVAFPCRRGKNAIARLAPLEDRARDAVMDLLPNNGGQQSNDHPLILLDKMNNRDKHRKISIIATRVAVYSTDAAAGMTLTRHTDFRVSDGPLPLVEIPRTTDANTHICHSIQIVFGAGVEAACQPVIPFLERIYSHIRYTVITTLEPFLGPA